MNGTAERIWPGALVAVLAGLYLWIGVAAHGWDRLAGIGGGVGLLTGVIWLATDGRRRAPAALLLLAGALPLAVLTWWSIVTPVLAALVLLFGRAAIRRSTESNRAAVTPAVAGMS